MIVHMLNPVIVKLGVLQIRWYGLMYILGIAIIYFILNHLVKKRKLKLSSEDVLDFVVYLAMGMLIGGRVLYFVFYDTGSIIHDPAELLRLWHGGMSFHGGLIGVIVAAYWYCRKKRLDFWLMADLLVIPMGIALALGRFGNFINGELYGKPWNGFLCIDYTHNPHLNFLPELCRYPTQLMEVAKNLVLFATMWTLRNKKLPKGFLFWLFITLYGVMRFFIEFLKLPDEGIGYVFGVLTMGQVLCALMIISGGTMLILLKYKHASPKKR
jgi:phosphatidylglycerol---prolipoprotein diacylglyceryl transferase